MKKIILISFLLFGCASKQPILQPNIVIAPAEIMEDCKEYIKPSIGTVEDLINTILENKKIYVECENQNKEKKNFINRQQNY